VAEETGTIIVLETPHRLATALSDILLVLGDRDMAVCRELTKVHEEVFRGTVSQAIARFTESRGEFVLIIAGKKEKDRPELTEGIKRQLREMRLSGVAAREAVSRMAQTTGLSKKELYRAWLKSS
jgi:16S rRNA (cytidine1402-2'-O)-methyltransferase